ncbi:unnamed protein product [Rotaria sp. Silwood2]|nr:unnamed protein product [Rotaria sp. Silwood2]
MVDSDGDYVRCRWANSTEECGSICTPKGFLRSNPCELTYNASRVGYQASTLVIEDFDPNNDVISAVPLQFLIHIVNKTSIESNCTESPIYIGERQPDSCIGIQSNETFTTNIRIHVSCEDLNNKLREILTVSPSGLIKGEIIHDQSDKNLYVMPIEWTPTLDHVGVQQLCMTPVDSHGRLGSQVCLTFQVDVYPPEIIHFTPTGLVSTSQSLWTIEFDRDIVRSRRSNGVYIRFFKHSNNQEVYRIDVANDNNVFYQTRQITFNTNCLWEQNEQYYILLDSGIATLNESCGIESVPIDNHYTWTFQVAATEITTMEALSTTERFVSTTTIETSTTKITTIPSPRPECLRWFYFDTISNESTSATEPTFSFCFIVNKTLTDVTISANTWVSCQMWKSSGTADPLIELYFESNNQLLAQNDDGFNVETRNCYAAVLSYRLKKGIYRAIIRNSKCAYGKFELRLSAEVDGTFK